MPVRVPTVERGLLWRMMLCCTAMVGPMPDMLSNLSSSSMPASMPKERRYCRRPSSKIMSKTRLDLPEPLTPVGYGERVFGDGDVYVFEVVYVCAVYCYIFHFFTQQISFVSNSSDEILN